MLKAIIAASIGIVPLPQKGSKKSESPSQPECNSIPAARTSFIGAISVASLYPLWCNEIPEESIDKVHFLLSIWILILKSGSSILILGLLPVSNFILSTIESFTFWETYKEFLKISP